MVKPDGLYSCDQLIEGGDYGFKGVRMVTDILAADIFEPGILILCPLYCLEIISSEVLVRDLDVAKRHFEIPVPEQFHDSGQADAVSQKLGGVGVPQAMWVDIVSNADGFGRRFESATEGTVETAGLPNAGEKKSDRAACFRIYAWRLFSTSSLDRLDERRCLCVDGNHSFAAQFSEGHAKREVSLRVFGHAVQFKTA